MAERLMERPVEAHRTRRETVPNAAYQAYSILYAAFIVLPIVAGADKFFNFLVDWTRYLSPLAVSAVGGRAELFMKFVGVVEIFAGFLVAIKPRLGSLVVGVWLLGIVGNLLSIPGFYDVAARDAGLACGAFALWRLSAYFREY